MTTQHTTTADCAENGNLSHPKEMLKTHSNHPYGNTGGTLGQALDSNKKYPKKKRPAFKKGDGNYPSRKSRAKTTSPQMQEFLNSAFIDWLTVSVPNGLDGTGRRIGTFETAADLSELEQFKMGEFEEANARNHLFMLTADEGLRPMRIGRGTDGFYGAAHLAFDPTSTERVATIRAGHSQNMPSMELPGASGICAKLAPKMLSKLCPINVARVDVPFDISKVGLWDDIDALATDLVRQRRRLMQQEYKGSEETGRSLYLGAGDVKLRVYEKSFELLQRKKIESDQLDPNLVRIEFSITPQRAAEKAALGRFLQEKNEEGALANKPGNLLKNYGWVRAFVERLAVISDYAEESQANLEVGRIERMPVSRPSIVRAQQAAGQYARTFCNAALAKMVDEEWGGNWQEAIIDPEEVTWQALALIRPKIESCAFDICEFQGTFEAQSIEEEAARAGGLLADWLERDAKLERKAKLHLQEAAEKARADFAMQEEACVEAGNTPEP